jgi:PAS domain S-box-containing protein
MGNVAALRSKIFQMYPYLEQMEESACVVDLGQPEQPLVYVNDNFLKMTLYPRSEIVGRNCRFLQGRFTNRETVAKMRKAIQEGTPLDVELLNYRKDGLPFWNNVLLLPFWMDLSVRATSRPTHFVAVQKDITFIRPGIRGLQIFFFH